MQNLFGFAGTAAEGSGAGIYYDPMSEARDDETFDIVGYAVIAALDECEGLGGAKKGKRAARADAEFKQIGLARKIDDLEQIFE